MAPAPYLRAFRVGIAAVLIVAGLSACRRSNPPPGGMVLLPGYHHSSAMGIDALYGEIWKWWSPEIVYETGPFWPDLTQVLDDIVSIETQTVAGYTLTVIKQKDHKLALMFQDACFMATNVRTQQDVDDILQIVRTYSSQRWKRWPAP